MIDMLSKVNVSRLYTIGEVAKMCNISRKTLRFYEELGLIIPDKIGSANGYRYYSEETMMLIPIIKYYKQMGFKLQEMNGVKENADYFYHEHNFLTKLGELKVEEQRIRDSYQAVSDWVNLLREGTVAIENNIDNVSIKYIDEDLYYYMEQDFAYDYMDAVINIPWVNCLEKNHCEITGPVILEFSSYQTKQTGQEKHVTILQKPVGKPKAEMPQKKFGGDLFLCAYHIGDPGDISTTYQKISNWAKEKHYECGPEAYERYVIDYWSTTKRDQFVTEVMIPAKKQR